MPYVNIKLTRQGGATPVQKAELINRVTDLIESVLNADPSTTRVEISEVEMDDWRLGGLTVEEFRRRTEAPRPPSRSAARVFTPSAR